MHTTNGNMRVTIINKGIKYWCSCLVVPAIGPIFIQDARL